MGSQQPFKRLKRPPTPWADVGEADEKWASTPGQQMQQVQQTQCREKKAGVASTPGPAGPFAQSPLPFVFLRSLLEENAQVLRAYLAFLIIFDQLPLVGGIDVTLAAMLVLIARGQGQLSLHPSMLLTVVSHIVLLMLQHLAQNLTY